MSSAPDGAPDLAQLVCYDDFLRVARARLDPMTYDYYRSGALRESTLAENERAWNHWVFRRRNLVGVADIDTSATVLGHRLTFPVIVGPTAFHRLADPGGEVATARAAAAAGTVMVASTLATMSLEDVAATGVPRWFQLYVFADRGLTRELVDRAVAAGYTALVPTVDTPTVGIRYADQRNRFALPPGMQMANVMHTLDPDLAASGSALRAFSAQFDQSLTWSDIEWLAGLSELPVLPKGVTHPDDARAALSVGAAGVIVSNHGGRQLDGEPGTADVLTGVVDAVGDAGVVLVDGGIRSGTDAVKAKALGAAAVLIGRPVLWALAAGGQAGVERMLTLLCDEVADTLRQLGVPRLAEVGSGAVMRRP
ncbi:MAG: alpha-hydroxy acid oxidase [Mycobacterium sp.]